MSLRKCFIPVRWNYWDKHDYQELVVSGFIFCIGDIGSRTGFSPKRVAHRADDMGYSDIGPFGGEIATPTLDTLAQEGLRLANFHVLASCSPSRSVLLSGMDNHRAGLGTMNEMMSDDIRGKTWLRGSLKSSRRCITRSTQSQWVSDLYGWKMASW